MMSPSMGCRANAWRSRSSGVLKSVEAKGLAIGLVLAFGGVALAGCSSAVGATGNKPSTSHSAEVKPSATPTPTETARAFTAESLELPTSLEPEQVGENFIADLNSVLNASETKEFRAAADKSAGTTSLSYADIAARQAPKDVATFAEAMLIPDYASKAPLASWVDGMTDAHKTVLTNWLLTGGNTTDPRDKEPYTTTTKVNSIKIVEQQSDTLQLSVDATQYDNGNENRVGTAGNGDHFVSTVVFDNVNNTWKVAAINIADYGTGSNNGQPIG